MLYSIIHTYNILQKQLSWIPFCDDSFNNCCQGTSGVEANGMNALRQVAVTIPPSPDFDAGVRIQPMPWNKSTMSYSSTWDGELKFLIPQFQVENTQKIETCFQLGESSMCRKGTECTITNQEDSHCNFSVIVSDTRKKNMSLSPSHSLVMSYVLSACESHLVNAR